jgi:hypothetical protein
MPHRQRWSRGSALLSKLDDGQCLSVATVARRKASVPNAQGAGWALGAGLHGCGNSFPIGFEPQTFQHVIYIILIGVHPIVLISIKYKYLIIPSNTTII